MTWAFTALALFVATLGMAMWRGRRQWFGSRSAGGGMFDTTTYKGRLTGMTVGVSTRAAVEFELHREGWLDRLGKRLGVSTEGQVGQRAFDDALYVVCDDPHVFTGLRFDPELPDALLDLFQPRGSLVDEVKRVTCREGVLRVELRVHGDEDDATMIARDVVPHLQAVRDRLDAAAGPPRRDRFWWRATWLLAIASGLAINGILQVVRTFASDAVTLDRGTLWLLGGGVGLLLAIALLVATWRQLGGSSRAHLVLFEVLVFGVPGVFATAGVAVRDYNMDADTSAISAYETRVIAVRQTYSRKGRTRHYMTLDAFPGSHGSLELRVSGRVPPGMPVRVFVHDGALGMAWLHSYQVGR